MAELGGVLRANLAGSEGQFQEAGQLRVDEGWWCIVGLGSQVKRFCVHSSPSQHLHTVFGGIL